MSLPKQVTVIEVGPRDGFQNEPGFVPTEQKIQIIDRLSETGLRKIEATAFVHPKAIPQLADAAEVMAGIRRREGVSYIALIPNVKGVERALQAGVKEVTLIVSASESHNRNNVNMSIAESLEALRGVARIALDNGMRVRGGVVTAFGCSIEGWVSPRKVDEIVAEYLTMGVHEISLADTVGMADPSRVSEMVGRVKGRIGHADLSLHLHNTRGAGLANLLAALLEGATIFDASICGLGGCPYAPGATGNIPTADVVNMLESMGIDTGIDLPKLIDCANMVRDVLGRKDLPGQVMKAGAVPWAIRKQASE